MKAYRVAVALAASLLAVGPAYMGCSAKSDHPPQLSAPSVSPPESPVECSELFAASDELRAEVPGPLVYDGGPAQCIVKGAECPLRDSDAGICDGGVPGAKCEGTQWFGACFSLDAGKPDGGDGGVP